MSLARHQAVAPIIVGAMLLACKPTTTTTPPEPAPAAPDTPAPTDSDVVDEPAPADPEAADAPAPEAEPVDATAPGEHEATAPASEADASAPAIAEAEPGPRAHCPDMGDSRFVYAFGSSNVGSLLGPMLQQKFKRRWPDVTVRKWGKASSGMARPDFHDWIKEVPTLNEEYDPDVYIVNLGTNDAQPLWDPKDKWIHANTPEWKQRYGERIDKILALMAGEDRHRLIVWIGPQAFPKKNSRTVGPKVNEVLRARIEAFDGHAFYVDAYTTTSPKRGQYIEYVKLGGKKFHAYQQDGIHLSPKGVQALMINPLLEIVEPCFDATQAEDAPKQS